MLVCTNRALSRLRLVTQRYPLQSYSRVPDALSGIYSRSVPDLRDTHKAHKVFVIDKARDFDKWAKEHLFGILDDPRYTTVYNDKPHLAVGTDLEWRPGNGHSPVSNMHRAYTCVNANS